MNEVKLQKTSRFCCCHCTLGFQEPLKNISVIHLALDVVRAVNSSLGTSY